MSWCALLLMVAACAQARIQEERAVRVAIDRANSGLSRWYASGDIDSIGRAFADSAWQLTTNGPAYVGRKAVMGHWATASGWGKWQYTFESDDVVVQGPVAVERGRYSLIFTSGPGAPAGVLSQADHGHYLTYWRLGDDKAWRITWTAPVSEVPVMVDIKH